MPPKKTSTRKKKAEIEENLEINTDDQVLSNNESFNNNPVIAKIEISKDSCIDTNNSIFENDYYKYTPEVGIPTSHNNHDLFSANMYTSQPDTITNSKNIMRLNPMNSILHSDWDKESKAACEYCCHTFTNMPFGYPLKFVNNTFYLKGNFCSLECACTHVFTSYETKRSCWDKYKLINELAISAGYGDIVVPAPNKNMLQLFGGRLTITEFRNFCKTSKTIRTLPYPIVKVVPQIEEICDFAKDVKFIPLDIEKLTKLEQSLYETNMNKIQESDNNIFKKMNISINKQTTNG